ncbi:MAG: 30S ribosomal protein S17 [Candidatus Woykebacteria bacterium]
MEFIGRVIGKKMDKTATVVVERLVTHPLYKKRSRKIKKYKVHDEINSEVGDRVIFTSSKPISKEKRFVIKEVLKK